MHKLRLFLSLGALCAVAVAMLAGCRGGGSADSLTGSLFVSDAGRSHGGFEYNASWNAELTLSGSTGTLKLTLDVGLGDALTKHEFAVTDFARDNGSLSLKLDGQALRLVKVAQDTVWDGEFNGYYIASWGSDAPAAELRGTISPDMFPGLAPHYYVELRLR